MSVRTQIPMQPAAAPAWGFTPLPFGTLQRKCACGGSAGAHAECAECRRKNAPAHDFSRVRVNAAGPDVPRPQVASLPELGCIGKLHQDTAGDTGCDVSVGTPHTNIGQPSLCWKSCTEKHEAMHAADLGPCCKRANKKYNAADGDANKTEVQDQMNQWVLDNKNYFECRGYGESVKCAEALIPTACNDSAPPQSAAPPGKQDGPAPSDPGAPATAPGQKPASAENLSEDAPGQAAPQYDIKLCCPGLKQYAHTQGLRRDAFCGAKKPLTYCPFPA